MGVALGMLQGQLEQTQYQEKTPHAQVQILGRLEGAGLRFTHLWLSGMGAAHWPTPASPSPFIPGTLQNRYELPHSSPAREYHFCEQLTERYRQSARELVFSYVNQIDGAQQVRSPLAGAARDVSLTELLGMEEQRLYYRYWSELRGQIACTEILEAPAPIAGHLEHLKGGAGLLDAQANCGFRAFARYRLQARALPQVSPGLSAAERGTLVHQALYLFWGDVDSSETLLEMDDTALELAIGDACKDAVAELPGWRKRQLGENTLAIERDRLHILLSRWLNYEKSRPTFTVVSREQGQQLEISGIFLDLRIDRIDRIQDGGHLLIDYKTGAGSIRDWLGDRPAKPQLPMYALANEETVSAIALGLVTMDKPGMVGLAASAATTDLTDVATFENFADTPAGGSSWAAQMDVWRGRLENLLQQYVEGSALIDPLNPSTTCRYCDFAQVCRKHERDAQGGSDRG
jgi:probable DNA repair protein